MRPARKAVLERGQRRPDVVRVDLLERAQQDPEVREHAYVWSVFAGWLGEEARRRRGALFLDTALFVTAWPERQRTDFFHKLLRLEHPEAHFVCEVIQGSGDEILNWVAHDYLPAYLPRAATDRLEELIEPATEFGDWLAEQYRELHMTCPRGVQHFLDGLSEKLLSAPVVLLVLDGVPLPAAEHLSDSLDKEGPAHLHEEDFYLALLPTLTHINQPAILLGSHPDAGTEPDVKTLSARWGVPSAQVTVRTVLSPEDLVQALPFAPGSLHVLHYRSVDRDLLHRPFKPWQRWLECLVQMEELAGGLAELFRRAQQQDSDLWVGLVADHGWTEVPSCATAVEVPEPLLTHATHSRVLLGCSLERYGMPLPAHL